MPVEMVLVEVERDHSDWLHDLAKRFLKRHGAWKNERQQFGLESDFQPRLGQVVRAARLRFAKKMTQEQFARKLGKLLKTDIDQSYCARIEKHFAATMLRVGAIAQVLKLTPAALVVGAETGLLLAQIEKDEDHLGALLQGFLQEVDCFLARDAAKVPKQEREAARLWLDEKSRAFQRLGPAVGATAKLFRMRHGFSQTTMATKVAKHYSVPITKGSLSQLECGYAPPSWPRLAAICTVLRDVTLGAVFVEAEREMVRSRRSLDEQVRDITELAGQVGALESTTEGKPTKEHRDKLAALANSVLAARRELFRLSCASKSRRK